MPEPSAESQRASELGKRRITYNAGCNNEGWAGGGLRCAQVHVEFACTERPEGSSHASEY
jgi:hypothetical protein